MINFRSQSLLAGGLIIASGCLAYAQIKAQTKHDKLFNLGVALLQYSDDYDGKLPVATNKEELQAVLGPYVQDKSVLLPAQNTNYFGFNFALSGKQQCLLNGKKLVAFYEVNPSKSQKRTVLFLPTFDKNIVHYAHNSKFVNKFIKEFDEKQWKKEASQQNLPIN